MIRFACAVASILMFATAAGAQSRVELFASAGVPAGQVSGSFDTDYTPILVFDDSATGRAAQTLQLDGGRPKGWLVGVNWMVTRRTGVQVFVDRASHVLGGVNTPTQVQLTYVSRIPPDYLPREVTVDYSSQWPETQGEITLWRVGGNGLWRVTGSRADVTLTGGILLSKVQGHFDQASYLEFHLGGHSTLFYEEAFARLQFADDWHLGYNLGAEVAVHVTDRLAVTGGLRLMPPASSAPVTSQILNTDRIIFEIPESTVQSAIGSRPARFQSWGSPEFTVGVRIAIH